MSIFQKRPPDALKALRQEAAAQVRDNAERAVNMIAAGPDPENSGDFILVGGHPLALDRVAIRLTPMQALGLTHQMLGIIMANVGNSTPPGGGEPAAAAEPTRKVG